MILNLTRKTVLADHPLAARSWHSRARGMIGRSFRGFDALVFEHCNAVHTCLMSGPIDVLFLDSENRVRRAVSRLRPWRLFCGCAAARTVIELPEGRLASTNTSAGDVLDWNAESVQSLLFFHPRIIPAPSAVPVADSCKHNGDESI